MDRAEINRAVQQAWTGLWQSCMRDAGGSSRLSFDAEVVERALNGHDEQEQWDVDLPIKPHRPEHQIPYRGKSEWARQLEGDARTSQLTLGDVLIGLDDYFRIFRQMKKANPHAYAYFSRVGAPLCFENTAAWLDTIHLAQEPPLVDVSSMPSYLGVFMVRSRDRARDDLINDKPSFFDFQLYEKRRRNIIVAAPWKWTIYDHQVYSLDRDLLNKAERKKFPHAGIWNYHYFIGVDEGGAVKALPMKMMRYQRLKSGDDICHPQFIVPPGLRDMSGKLTVDQYVAKVFAVIRGFCAAALSGVQLSVRRDDEIARFGIPLSYVRSFFRDREREGARRSPLLHLVGEYSYDRSGRTVTVGEHLRGARRFKWRGHDIVVSAPGIHYVEPETLSCETLTDEDILPLPRDGGITLGEAAAMMQNEIEAAPRVPFRKGMPTVRRPRANLDDAIARLAARS